jgi:hypothetical protein
MMGRVATVLVATVVGGTLLLVVGLMGLTSGAAACAPRVAPTLAASGVSPQLTAHYDPDQLTNAATIVTVGADRGIPPRGEIIAVATALQESDLRNLGDLGAANDHDSLGLFQQRPSQGWGTPEQLLDPVYAANTFYDKLLTVPGWQRLPLTDAAQAVQRSAYPDAYVKWEPDATALVAVNAGMYGDCAGGTAVLLRAASWLTAWKGGPVPYLSSGDPSSWFGGYRRDCSGYASMALGLPGPGLSTTDLAARATPLPKPALRPGDLLIQPAPDLAGHVAIFDHWTDSKMTSYIGYEQSGDGGTHHRVIPYPYFDGYQMSPYRWTI